MGFNEAAFRIFFTYVDGNPAGKDTPAPYDFLLAIPADRPDSPGPGGGELSPVLLLESRIDTRSARDILHAICQRSVHGGRSRGGLNRQLLENDSIDDFQEILLLFLRTNKRHFFA
jgi:hypothetical protein